MEILSEKSKALLALAGLRSDILGSDNPRVVFDEYMDADDRKAIIEEYVSLLRERLFELAVKYGVSDDKGSSTVMFTDGKWFKKEARTSVSIDKDKLRELANQKGLNLIKYIPKIKKDCEEEALAILATHYGELMELDEVVDESELQQAYMDGAIDDDEFGSIVSKKVNYALKKSK